MTVAFRIESLLVDTTNGAVGYDFSTDLTVLVGHTGVGKTALVELIKFGLGGDADIAPVARQHILDVHLSVRIGADNFRLSRGLDIERRKTVRVFDLIEHVRMPDVSVNGDESTISDLLLSSMGIETGLKAAARGSRSTSEGTRITFNDVFRFMYISQADINHDIAWSQDNYYDPKRKAVFELLFELTSASLLQRRSEVNRLKAAIDVANNEVAIVRKFLDDTGLATRSDALTGLERARQDESAARATLSSLQGDLVDAVDRETHVLRDLLSDAERSLAEADDLSVELSRQREEYGLERRRVSQEVSRLARMSSAGLRLANIEFSLCPRCTQRLDQRDVPPGICRVCLQDDIVGGLTADDQYETEQLQAQISEISEQLRLIELQDAQTTQAATDRRALVSSLTTQIDDRTANRITPRLQAYADAVAQIERALGQQHSLEGALKQWDREQDLVAIADGYAARRAQLQAEIRTIDDSLLARKAEIFEQLDAEFASTVADFRIPSVESASISPDTYLPILNGQPFTEVSKAGGIITATQVAYWISLLTVAARQRDTRYPAFLLLDSPRLALSTEDDIAGQMYRRFAVQVDASPGRLQFIVADNDVPPVHDRTTLLTFSYDAPTISSVKHPGLPGVAPRNEWE